MQKVCTRMTEYLDVETLKPVESGLNAKEVHIGINALNNILCIILQINKIEKLFHLLDMCGDGSKYS